MPPKAFLAPPALKHSKQGLGEPSTSAPAILTLKIPQIMISHLPFATNPVHRHLLNPHWIYLHSPHLCHLKYPPHLANIRQTASLHGIQTTRPASPCKMMMRLTLSLSPVTLLFNPLYASLRLYPNLKAWDVWTLT